MRITIEISKESTKRLLVIGGFLFVALTAVAVRAALTVPTFNSGDVLQAASLSQLGTDIVNLDARATSLQSQLTTTAFGTRTPSAFHATLTNATSVPSNVGTTIVFNQTDYDLASEYSAATGIFTAQQSGIYLVRCNFTLNPGTPTAGDWGIYLIKNGADVEVSGSALTASAITPTVEAIMQLSATDKVSCKAAQGSGASQPLYLVAGQGRATFGAARLY